MNMQLLASPKPGRVLLMGISGSWGGWSHLDARCNECRETGLSAFDVRSRS
jgi:hypothetical protein